MFGGSAPHATYGEHVQGIYTRNMKFQGVMSCSRSCPSNLLTVLPLLSDNAEFEANEFLAFIGFLNVVMIDNSDLYYTPDMASMIADFVGLFTRVCV